MLVTRRHRRSVIQVVTSMLVALTARLQTLHTEALQALLEQG